MRKSLVSRIFLIIFGLIIIVGAVAVVNSITTSVCTPTEIYGDEGVTGFGGSFVDSLYDSLCANVLDTNNGIWNFYEHWFVGLIGQKGTVANVGADLWGMGKIFCQTHSNFDYSGGEQTSAVSSTNTFLQLFTYEVERCWTMFEGERTEPDNDRHPLGKQGMFDCGEIIYDFTDAGDSVSLGELYARLSSTNACGQDLNSPVEYINAEDEDEDDKLVESVTWCAPKKKLSDYWDENYYFMSPETVKFSGASVDEIRCTSEDEDPNAFKSTGMFGSSDEVRSYDTSMCLPYTQALCSFSNITGYNRGSGSDESALINGCGKITITYYDYFDWGSLWNYQRTGDDYDACDGVDAYNDFADINRPDANSEDDYSYNPYGMYTFSNLVKKRNGLIVCFEKFETKDGECEWE